MVADSEGDYASGYSDNDDGGGGVVDLIDSDAEEDQVSADLFLHAYNTIHSAAIVSVLTVVAAAPSAGAATSAATAEVAAGLLLQWNEPAVLPQ
jgi:hypothetical protein